jgi:hypothetical protein
MRRRLKHHKTIFEQSSLKSSPYFFQLNTILLSVNKIKYKIETRVRTQTQKLHLITVDCKVMQFHERQIVRYSSHERC